MNYDKYDFILESPDLGEFRFYSEGPNGRVEMIIQFQKMYKDFYNLAFGQYNEGNPIDDLGKTNNFDRNKILATVASAIVEYFYRYPGRLIYFKGSTPSRNRLYRMAIAINIEQLMQEFNIFGNMEIEGRIQTEEFRKQSDYIEFFITKKVSRFII